MKTDKKSNWSSKKTRINNNTKKQEIWSDKIKTKETMTNTSESDVSVFTKTTKPNLVIKSEKIRNNYNNCNSCCQKQKIHKILYFICMIIICIIILMTFFLTLKTYNAVEELSEYIML